MNYQNLWLNEAMSSCKEQHKGYIKDIVWKLNDKNKFFLKHLYHKI